MPYLLDPGHRYRLISGTDLPQDAADINFLICDLVDNYLGRMGLSYANLNECVGAIECAKLEIYRRVAAPYEDRKVTENGEVFHDIVRGL